VRYETAVTNGLLEERDWLYGSGKCFGILRCAQDDGKNKLQRNWESRPQ